MSSTTLVAAQEALNLYGYSSLLILGNTGNLFAVAVLSRHRQNACSTYLLYLAIVSSIYITFHSCAQLFPFPLDPPSLSSLLFCKLRLYLATVLGQLAKTLVILACIDRYLVTNERASFRTFNTVRRAQQALPIFLIFWLLACSHIAVLVNVGPRQCAVPGLYFVFYTLFRIIVAGLIPPLMMTIFTWLTYRNLRRIQMRVHSVATPIVNASLRRRDRELLRLVICQILLYIFTTTPALISLIGINVTQWLLVYKDAQYQQVEVFVAYLTLFISYVNDAAPFYVYFIASKSFQQESIRIVQNGFRKLRNRPLISTATTTSRAM